MDPSAKDEISKIVSTPDYAMYQVLLDLCNYNANFFRNDDTEPGQRLFAGLLALIDHVNAVTPLVDQVRQVAPNYDFDENTIGNGYRSFVTVVDMCITHGVKLNRQICDNREWFLFRKTHYMREVEACSHVMASLATCMQHLLTLMEWSELGQLFPKDPHPPEELLKRAANINMYCFYGRCLGFQFCESMQKILKTISICMASFSEMYFGKNSLKSVWTGSKYLLDPELRARRIVNISQHASVDFCKSFWLLAESELMARLPAIMCPVISVNKIIHIPPEVLYYEGPNNQKVEIPIPSSHIGTAPVTVRLLSAVHREGMVCDGTANATHPPSSSLIIHCHGGGFVAQSSRSHELYLRDWACQLAIPILSVDYSLAPQAPFPRALEEVLYAYCWALNNKTILGTTAEKVIFAGDSAGANLLIGTAMKCIELGLPIPTGLFLAYVPVLVSLVASPSRLLCLMDPLLPFGFMIRCLKAYACSPETDSVCTPDSKDTASSSTPKAVISMNGHIASSNTESFEELSLQVSESDLLELAAHKSPMSDTLTTVSLTSLQSRGEGGTDSYISVQKGDVKEQSSSQSEQYVAQFLDKYVLDSEEDEEGRKVPVLRTETELEEKVLFEVPSNKNMGFTARIGRAAGNLASGVTNTFNYVTGRKSSSDSTTPLMSSPDAGNMISPQSISLEISSLDSLMQRSPSEELCFSIPRDPYLSPYYASDNTLKELPPISVMTVQMDPCLDDCVMFCKKLKGLGNKVHLDVLEGLPHGFLNFSMLSKEAHIGSNLCVKKIQELFSSEL